MRKDVAFINPESNVAVVTLWTKKEVVLEKLRELGVEERVHAVGTLYTAYGVNYLLHSLARNPRIDTLVVFGADLSDSGDALVGLFRGRPPPSLKLMWPLDVLKPLLEAVRVVDLREAFKRGDWAALREAVLESYKPGASRHVLGLELEEVKVDSWPLQAAGAYVVESDLLRAWVKLLDSVMRWGRVKPSEYGERQKQLLGALAVLRAEEALRSAVRLQAYIPAEELEKHARSLLEGARGASYSYGDRLRAHREAGDQLSTFIAKLSSSPATRRAVMLTWDFAADPASPDPPCLLLVQGDLTDRVYSQVAYFRSHDAFGAWPLNAYALLRLMEEVKMKLESETGESIRLGNLLIFSASLHVYEHDWPRARDLLEKNLEAALHAFVRDDKGDFLVRVEGGEIVLELRDPSGALAFSARGCSARDVLKKINLTPLMPSHAAYLGRELARAEHALKHGLAYTQDDSG
ncbi:MAG: thymidylate synthase [Thermofilum sp.]